ncbi:MAG: hypothetical protein JRJ70_17165 [Deltaproteobacteria bacterium]|nr:hypothetical protein [Deltaproteobacteria bacterium]
MENHNEKPGMLTVVSILLFISAGINILGSIGSVIIIILYGTIIGIATFGIGFLLYFCLVFPIVFIIWGVIEILYGMKILKDSPMDSSPFWLGIVEIAIGILSLFSIIGIIELAIGITNTVLLTRPEVKDYIENNFSNIT